MSDDQQTQQPDGEHYIIYDYDGDLYREWAASGNKRG